MSRQSPVASMSDTLIESLYPYFIVSKFFCLAPYSLNVQTSRTQNIIHIAQVLLSVTILIGTQLLFNLNNEFEKTIVQIYPSTISRIGNIVDWYFHNFVVIVSILITFLKRQKLACFIKSVQSIDSYYLTRLPPTTAAITSSTSYDCVRHFAIICCIVIIVRIITVILCIKALCSILSVPIHYGTLALGVIGDVVPLILQTQFICGALLMVQRYKTINTTLQHLYNEQKSLRHSSNSPTSIGKHLEADLTIHESNVLQTFNDVSIIHARLTDAANLLNSIYSAQLLLTIAKIFISTLFAIFCLFKTFLCDSESKNDHRYAIILSTAYFHAGHILTLFGLIFVSVYTIEESQQISVWTHKLLNQVSNTTVITKAQSFSLQTLHHTAKFSACGFFPLDKSLLYSFCGTVVTYFVILIQFEIGGK